MLLSIKNIKNRLQLNIFCIIGPTKERLKSFQKEIWLNLNMIKGGIYIHVPFCKQKCIYCDFYSGGVRIAQWDKFTESLLNEFKFRKEELLFQPTTLYIGGGTPSLVPSKNLEKLVDGIKELTGVNKWEEFTLEVNPDDVDHEQIKLWKDVEVNRISIGIQSLNDEELKRIGRQHSSDQSLNALVLLKNEFENISVDVMFGLPGQTLKSYKQTLDNLLKFDPKHVSAYSLMLEDGTALTNLVNRKKIILPDEEEWIEMYNYTHQRLKASGFEHYEVSNYSEKGFESRHNNLYWERKPYLGIGPSAHSFDGKDKRRWNPNDIKSYLNRYHTVSGEIFYSEEVITPEEQLEETIMTGLRLGKGISLSDLKTNYGEKAKNELLQKAIPYIDRKELIFENDRMFLSEEGFLLYNTIVSNLI